MTPRLSRIAVVVKKELIDTVRDRKSLVNVVRYSLMGPLMLVVMTTFLVHALSRDANRTLLLPVVGADRAPHLIEALADHNIKAVPPPANPREAVVSEKEEAVLVVSDDYAESLHDMRPAMVTLIVDDARQSSAGHVRRIAGALKAYDHLLGIQRLVARGVNASILHPLAVVEDNTAPPEASGAMLLGIIPVFVMMSFLMGAMYSAVDSMAGERERGSLEPLLANAITDAEAILGKAAALGLLSLVSSTVTAIGFACAVASLPSAEDIGMKFGLSAGTTLQILLNVLPLAPLTATALLWSSARAKSVRDANTQAMALTMIPSLSGLTLLFVRLPTWVAVVPYVGQQMILSELLRGSAPSLSVQLLGAAVALAAGIALTVAFIHAHARARQETEAH